MTVNNYNDTASTIIRFHLKKHNFSVFIILGHAVSTYIANVQLKRSYHLEKRKS
jgi:hypothetical protein